MKHTAYRWESLSPFDLQGTEEHLSAMAAKGWRLEHIGRAFWRYRSAEPAALQYAVAAAPAAGENGDLSDQLYFQELCAAAGWEKVTDWAELQIYATGAENPVPPETDASMRLESVHRSMRRTYLRNCRSNLMMELGLLALWLANLASHPHTYLLSGLSLAVPLTCLFMILLNAFSIAGYFSWRRRSLRSVEEGGGLADVPRSYRTVNRLSAAILLLLALTLIPLEMRRTPLLIITLGGATLGAVTAWAAKHLCRSQNWDGYTQAAVTVLAILALLAASYGLAGSLRLDQPPGLETPSYEWSGEHWDLEPQPIPLTIEDLTRQPWDHVRRTVRTEGRTLFASENAYTERAAREDGGKAYLRYILTDVPSARLRQAVFDDIRNGPSFLEYRAEDPGPWGAEAAYRLYYPDARGATDEWLVLWPGRVLAVYAEGLDLGPEEMAVIRQRLTPETEKEEAR